MRCVPRVRAIWCREAGVFLGRPIISILDSRTSFNCSPLLSPLCVWEQAVFWLIAEKERTLRS